MILPAMPRREVAPVDGLVARFNNLYQDMNLKCSAGGQAK